MTYSKTTKAHGIPSRRRHLISDSNVGNFLGSYGVDIATHTVWAVVDHNSRFAVVPEPSSLILLAIGALIVGFAPVHRRWGPNRP